MFKDAEEALKRLEAELLADEQNKEQPQEDYDIDELLASLKEETDSDEILSDEELDALLQDTQLFGSAVKYQNHANNYGAQGKTPRVYNTDNVEQKPEELSEKVLEQPQPEKLGGLIALACALSLGIIAVLVWWFIRFRGVF